MRIHRTTLTSAIAILTALGAFAQDAGQVAGLTLKDVRYRVLEYNERVQVKMLDTEISEKQIKAERGIFEPAVVSSFEATDSKRKNSQEQQAQQFFKQVFDERNKTYNGGLEFLAPTGGKLRLGYMLRDMSNNLNSGTNEYATTVGVTLSQPLLKNGGVGATMARIRLAAINSDIAYQDYRRELMTVVARAEAAYWDLYLTQEQERISRESVTVAEKLFKDNKARMDVGKSSELEVLQAEAGLSLRKTRQSDASQRLAEAASNLNSLLSGAATDRKTVVRAVETPVVSDKDDDFMSGYQTAFELNPDYQGRRHAVLAENIRLSYAKNQKLPELDLKASYGLNGLAGSPGASFDDAANADYPTGSVGLEFRVPLSGGIKERNEYEAAKLSKKKALLALKEVEVQMVNGLDTALLKVRNQRESVKGYEAVARFHQQLLETELAKLEVGKTDSRTVLETEEKLFEARISMIDAMVRFQKAGLELELIKGAALRNRGIDISKNELQRKTMQLIADNKFQGSYLDQLRTQNDKRTSTKPAEDPLAQQEAERQLREKIQQLRQQDAPK